jgi:hypothetical protein
MLVERETILQAGELVDTGWPDVVLLEDVSKLYRNPRWIFAFVQNCVDHDIRVIAPGDALDTWEENWEVVLHTATLRHGLHIPDTRRRVRRTSAKTFDEGGMVLRVRFAYRRLSKEEANGAGGSASKGLRIAACREQMPIIRELRRRVVQERQGGAALARWLNEQGIPTGPYAKLGRWTGRLVLDFLRDPILYGLRQFPKVKYEPRFIDGKHKRRKNENPQRHVYPELAHLTKEEFEQMQLVLSELAEPNDGHVRASGEQHARFRVRRTDTVTPFQHMTCAICGSPLYPCGLGAAKCMRPLGRGDGTCWNHVQVNCAVAREKLVDMLLQRVARREGAMDVLIKTAYAQVELVRSRSGHATAEIDHEIENLQRQADRLAAAIAEGGELPSLLRRAKEVEAALKRAQSRRRVADRHVPTALPSSRQELALDPRPGLLEMAATSFEFGQLMRTIFPRFEIVPVQGLDCGQVRARAQLTLDLGKLWPRDEDPSTRPTPEEVVLDLFDPPEHIKHLQQVVATKHEREQRKQKVSLDILAHELKIGRMTVKRALGYAKLMCGAGETNPYRALVEAPASASRWKSPQRGNSSSHASIAKAVNVHRPDGNVNIEFPDDPGASRSVA